MSLTKLLLLPIVFCFLLILSPGRWCLYPVPNNVCYSGMGKKKCSVKLSEVILERRDVRLDLFENLSSGTPGG